MCVEGRLGAELPDPGIVFVCRYRLGSKRSGGRKLGVERGDLCGRLRRSFRVEWEQVLGLVARSGMFR